MATQTSAGNEPRVVSDERLDLPDFNSVSASGQGALLAALGGAIGPYLASIYPYGGCASILTTSWDGGTKFLTINEGLFYQGGTLASPVSAPSGRFVVYDPTGSAAQIAAGTGIDLTGEAAASTPCIVWATRNVTQSALELRKRWLPGATAESSFATNTRNVEIVEFTVTAATFSGAGAVTTVIAPPSSAWFPILKITAWPAGVPTVGLISYWDGTESCLFVGDVNTNVSSIGAPGVASLLYHLRRQLARLFDNTDGTSWNNFAGRGVKQLDTDLTADEAALAVVQERTGFGTITAFGVSNGGSWDFDQGASAVRMTSVTNSSTGVFDFVVDPAFMGSSPFLEITAITVTLQGVAGVPAARLVSAYDITNPTVGTFTVRFFTTAGTLTDPSNDGFGVVVSGY